ncbi:MAG: dioxygenase [Bacteroidetes bacterium]|nr:dioxygenase [Bacteroidota bacterium]
MKNLKQPSLFISHGTIYEALTSNQLRSDFKRLREENIKNIPSAIVLFSGHWQTESISITTAEQMIQMDEGFPSEFQTNYSTVGNPELAKRIIEKLQANGIKVQADHKRGLDHGALIPLILLFRNTNIPVLQISQQFDLDPVYHKKIAEILNPLRNENILFIGSGGLVHNRSEIQKFGGHEIEPAPWARNFDEFITNQLSDTSDTNYTDKVISSYAHHLFLKSHPTSEHFLPLVFASAFGGQPTKIYSGFQWKNLSMSAFKFE